MYAVTFQHLMDVLQYRCNNDKHVKNVEALHYI